LRFIVKLLEIKRIPEYLNDFLNNMASTFLLSDYLVLSSRSDREGDTLNNLNEESLESGRDLPFQSESEGPENEPEGPENESESDPEAEEGNSIRSFAEDSGIERSDQGSPNDHVPESDSEAEEERAYPEKDDLEAVEAAEGRDFDAIAELKEKYPAFFDDLRQSTDTSLANLRQYIESETRANPASPSPSEDSAMDPHGNDPISHEASPSANDQVPSVNDQIPSEVASSANDEIPSEVASSANNEIPSEVGPSVVPESTSKKHKRGESTEDLQSENKKKSKTDDDDDDDDSNNNPPSLGGSGGLPPTEGGNSSSNEVSNSSNSMSIIEKVVLVLSTVMEFIAKAMENIL
jgi:hypothetical protein